MFFKTIINSPVKNNKSGLVKIFLILISAFVVLLILLLIFIRTGIYKNWLLQYTVGKINEEFSKKESFLSIESIEGDIFGDFIIKNAVLIIKSDTTAKFDTLGLEFEVLPLLNKKINIKNLRLVNPEINMTKVRDKDNNPVYNLIYLLQSEEKEEDTIKKEFDWEITADNLEIKNGNFRFLSFKNSDIPVRQINMTDRDTFDLDYLDVKNLELQLSGIYFPDVKHINIRKFSFSTNSLFNLKELVFNAKLEKNYTAEINNFKFITGRSNLNIKHALLTDLNPFEGIDYEKFSDKTAGIDLLADRFNFDDLVYFLPDLGFIKGKAYLNLKAGGKYGNLKITQLDLKAENSEININGYLKNLNEPSKLFLDVSVSKCDLNPSDINKILPELDIPDYSQIGSVRGNFTFNGEPLRFDSEFNLISSAGNASGNTYLDLTQNDLVYRTDIALNNLNIGKITKDKTLESNINADLYLQGAGTDYRNLHAKINYEVHNSSILNQKISKSSGRINASAGNYDVDIFYVSNSGAIKCRGNLNIRNPKAINYDIKGNGERLNLSSITGSESNSSNLNFSYDIKGAGINPENVEGKFNFMILPSTYQNYRIPETPLIAEIHNTKNSIFLNIKTDIFDLEARGKISIFSLPEIIAKNLEKITEVVRKGLERDTIGYAEIYSGDSYSNPYPISVMDYTDNEKNISYNLKIKNILPLRNLIGDSSITFKGEIKGNIYNSDSTFYFNSNCNIQDLRFRDSVLIAPQLGIDLYAVTDDNNKLNSWMNLHSGRLSINGNKLDSLYLKLGVNEQYGKFLISGYQDTTTSLNISGMLGYGKKYSRIIIDTADVKYRNYGFSNMDKLNLKLIPADTLYDIEFDKFKISSDRQNLEIKGMFSYTGENNLQISTGRIKVSDLQLLSFPRLTEQDLVKGNIRRLEIKFNGLLRNPEISLEANTDVLKLGNVKLGRLDALIDYKDNTVKPLIYFFNPNNAGKFHIYGDIPLQNPFLEDSLMRTDYKDNIVNLVIDSKNFNIALLDQFAPVVSGLDGIMNGTIYVKGTVSNPVLGGNMNIENGAFRLNLTGMRYNFISNLTTDNQKLIVQNIKLYRQDENTKFITIKGYMDFSNLKFNDMDLSITGDIKVMDNSITYNPLGVYGDIYAGSGTPNLKLKGNADRINLTGNLTLKKGNVYVPPFKQNAYSLYTDNFVYRTIIDTNSFGNKDSIIATINNFRSNIRNIDKRRIDPFEYELIKDTSAQVTIGNSQGKFTYDLIITNDKNIFVKMIIDDKTKQEFFGTINSKLFIDNKDNGKLKINGKVELGENSFYKFYKNFSSDGYIEFNGPLDNPELHINGLYKSTSPDPQDTRLLRDVSIKLEVRGNISNPQLRWAVEVDGSPYGGNDPTDQAISFIVFGKFKDELSASQRSDLFSSVGANVGSTFMSSYLSSLLKDYLPFIVNADINYVDNQNGDIAKSTDIRLTAELGDATIRLGGQILRDISNTNIAIEYPLNKLLMIKKLSSDLVIKFERIVDPYSQNRIATTTESRTGGSILYKIKF